jgi:hypothetical protein
LLRLVDGLPLRHHIEHCAYPLAPQASSWPLRSWPGPFQQWASA